MIQHNSQGEAFDPVSGTFNYIHISKFFCLNFIVIFSFVFSVFMLMWLSSFLVDKIIGIKNSRE